MSDAANGVSVDNASAGIEIEMKNAESKGITRIPSDHEACRDIDGEGMKKEERENPTTSRNQSVSVMWKSVFFVPLIISIAVINSSTLRFRYHEMLLHNVKYSCHHNTCSDDPGKIKRRGNATTSTPGLV